MKRHIKTRVIELADHVIKTKETVRETAKKFGVSKSTVHKDVTIRLKNLDYERFLLVKDVLEFNLSERAVRGGEATRKKYLAIKTEKQKSDDKILS